MSEMPFFGRTSIYIVTLLIFVLLQLAVIYAKNFGMLLAFRFITGFIGSPVSILQNSLGSFPYVNADIKLLGPCNGRCVNCRHVRTQETNLWHSGMGYCCRVRPCSWASRRWLRGREQGLAMANLGAHVAVRGLSYFSHILLTRDLRK